MNYTEKEFFALVEAVEDQGGEHLDATCPEHVEFEFTGDQNVAALKAQPSIRYCGNPSLFLIPYEAINRDGSEAGLQPVKACAVDDDMGRWPRFGGDKFAGPEHFIKPKEDG